MTIDKGNKKIYETVYQQKALTEQIVGVTSHSFPFVKAKYKAVCTEAIDFTMFDKVICGILQIDDILSFEEIADILGLNVVNCPEEGRYIDYGEKEILEFAINSLIEFNMIETGDIYHSRCRLTEIGKEYAAKGKKFLPATEKEFELYFDLTDQNHIKAKRRFGKIKKIPSQKHSSDLDIETEQFVKEVAKTQVPEIYNPEQLRNFTNLELRGSTIYSPEFSIVALVSFIDNSVRFLAFDDKQEIHHPITEMINADDNIGNEILEKFDFETCEITEKNDIQKSYEAKAINVQKEIEKLLSGKQLKEAFEKSKAFYLESAMIDEAYLELNLEEVFDKESREFWMILSDVSENIFSKIKVIINKQLKPHNRLFIVTKEGILSRYEEYLTKCSIENPWVYFSSAKEIESPFILSKNGENKWVILKTQSSIKVKFRKDYKLAKREVLVKSSNLDSSIIQKYNIYKDLLGHEYFHRIEEEIKIKLNNLSINKGRVSKIVIGDVLSQLKILKLEGLSINKDGLSKKVINDVSSQLNSLKFFLDNEKLKARIKEFLENSEGRILMLKGDLESKLEEELKSLEERFKDNTSYFSISELRNFEDSASKIINEVFDEKSDVASKCKVLVEEVQGQIKALSSVPKKTKPKRKKPNRSTNKKR
ncbi:hypothetical protein [Phaeodactylibacter xiamenensis]|uniref:hypothetical protein n=1 Tax=Phaeodactylibacter xiamenensis TaxID=1524460 RepID=UPI003BAB0AEC